MSLIPQPATFARVVVVCILLVAAAHFSALYVFYTGGQTRRMLAKLLLLDREANFSTFFNFSLFIAASVSAGLATMVAFRVGNRWRWHWGFLAAIMLLLSYDEASLLHERLVPVMARFSWAQGPLYYGWVVPGFAFAALVGLAYLGFLLALPRRIGVLMFLSGLCYVSGALGFEMLGAAQRDANEARTLAYELTATVEEILEMSGLALFTYAVLCWLSSEARNLRWTLAGE